MIYNICRNRQRKKRYCSGRPRFLSNKSISVSVKQTELFIRSEYQQHSQNKKYIVLQYENKNNIFFSSLLFNFTASVYVNARTTNLESNSESQNDIIIMHYVMICIIVNCKV